MARGVNKHFGQFYEDVNEWRLLYICSSLFSFSSGRWLKTEVDTVYYRIIRNSGRGYYHFVGQITYYLLIGRGYY